MKRIRSAFFLSVLLTLHLGILIPACSFCATPERKVRVDIAPLPFRSGTMLLEERVLKINDGENKVESTKGIQSLALRYQQRVNLSRRVQSAENEDVMVEDHAEDMAIYFATPPQINEQPGILARQHLHARKRLGLWLYEPQDRKPDNALNAALLKLSWMSSLLDVVPAGIGTQQRTTGETWKTDFPVPRGRQKGTLILSGYECTLVAVEDVQGVPHARIAVQGTLNVEQPTYAGAGSLAFTGHVLRRLKDRLDVETKLSGSLSFTGPVTEVGGTPATLKLKLPCELHRTLRIKLR